jgi:uncharacterized protein (TIGR01244 family)
MSLTIRHLDPDFAVSGQLAPQDFRQVADQGFRTVINNRPDKEAADQPSSEELAQAARAAGLHYVHLPVISGAITPAQARAMRTTLEGARGPVLAFCRSGTRSGKLYELAQAADR